MVGAMILYDHVHPVGAFAKKAGIDVSYCVEKVGGRGFVWEGLIQPLGEGGVA